MNAPTLLTHRFLNSIRQINEVLHECSRTIISTAEPPHDGVIYALRLSDHDQ